MAEILQIIRALGLYALTLAITLPNLWILTRMLRTGPLVYGRKLEIFTFGMIVCLPVYYLEVWLLGFAPDWIAGWFFLARGDGLERAWLTNLLVVAPVEEGFKALAFAAALWRLRRMAPEHNEAPAAPVFWAALLAAGFASFENVLYGLKPEVAHHMGFTVIGLRAVTSSLIHCAATSMLGLAIGLKRRFRLPGWLAVAAGFGAAVLIHAGYNLTDKLDLSGWQARVLVQASVAVVASGLPPLLAYALGLIDLRELPRGAEPVDSADAGGPAGAGGAGRVNGPSAPPPPQ